jgi:hypothetical protein
MEGNTSRNGDGILYVRKQTNFLYIPFSDPAHSWLDKTGISLVRASAPTLLHSKELAL